MKKLLLLVTMLLAINMVGCSSGGDTLEVKDGVIYNNGEATTVVVHTGTTAQEPYSLDPNIVINIEMHNAFGDCNHNDAGVAIGNVSKSDRDKSISYFTAYQGTQLTMHKETKGHFICAFLSAPESLQSDVAINQLTNCLSTLVLSDNYKKAKIGLIEVHDWPEISVTRDSISIPGSLMILKGNVNTTETREFNKQSVGYLADPAYDYYQYGEYVVQALKGFDISQCITFLKQ